MKNLSIAFSLLFAANLATAQGDQDAVDVSYIIGHQIGASLGQFKDDIDRDVLIQALRDGIDGKESKFSQEESAQKQSVFFQSLQQRQGRDNLATAESFLAENGKKEGWTTTASGLQYKVLTPGDGAQPTAEDTVTVHYTGTFIDGKEFDSSVTRGEPATFPLTGVIKGWTEGLQLMKIGSKFRFAIHPDLGYGPSGNRGIPPNSALIFDIELISIK